MAEGYSGERLLRAPENVARSDVRLCFHRYSSVEPLNGVSAPESLCARRLRTPECVAGFDVGFDLHRLLLICLADYRARAITLPNA